MNYDESIEWLYSTQLFGIKLGLEGPTQLLREALAFPKRGIKVVQVAGTNGKGSVCALIDSLARSCGWRTGLFTSPHLVDYRERMHVSGEMISQDECADFLTQLRVICERQETHPTFFEITLACALMWFNSRKVELVILEVGMGGRLDATTAVPVDIGVITPIALDHTKWLGTTIAEVAGEKAGIIRENQDVFSSPQVPDAERVLLEEASQKRAELTFVREALQTYTIGLPGAHQRENASLALAVLHKLGALLSYDAVVEGLKSVRHEGRFERVTESLVLDAAHNPHAAQSLVSTWKEEMGEQKAQLIFGAVADKDVAAVAKVVEPIAERVLLVPVNSERGLAPEDLQQHFSVDCRVCDTLETALGSTRNALTLLTGSLFLVGEAKALLRREKQLPSDQ